MNRLTHKDRAMLRFIAASRMAAAAPDTRITHRLVSGALARYLQEAEDRQEDISDWLWELIGLLCFQADQLLLPDQGRAAALTFSNPSGDHLDPEEMSQDPVLAGLVNAGRLLTAYHNDDPETCGAIVAALLATNDSTTRMSATITELAVMPYRMPSPPPRSSWIQVLRRRGWFR